MLLYALTITLQVRLRLKAGWAAEGFKFALSLKLSTLEHAMLPQLTLRVDRLVVGLVADVELVPRTTMPFRSGEFVHSYNLYRSCWCHFGESVPCRNDGDFHSSQIYLLSFLFLISFFEVDA